MRRFLLWAAIAVVVVATIVVWSSASHDDVASQRSSKPIAAPASAPNAAPVELAKAEAETPVSAEPKVDASRVAVPPPSTPSSAAQDPVDPTAPPGLVDMATAATATAETAITDAEREFLAKKYASSNRTDRRLAREKLEAFVLAHKRGEVDKSQRLAPEQIVALQQEITWLTDNPGR